MGEREQVRHDKSIGQDGPTSYDAGRLKLASEGNLGFGSLGLGQFSEIGIHHGKFSPVVGADASKVEKPAPADAAKPSIATDAAKPGPTDAAKPSIATDAAKPAPAADAPQSKIAPGSQHEIMNPRAEAALRRAVVQIQSSRVNSDANGSGFIVSGNEVVTNMHVVGNSKSLEVMTPSGETFQAKVKKVDPIHDLAVLDVAGLDAKPDQQVKFANSNELDPTSALFALGHPNGQTEIALSAGTFLGNTTYGDTFSAMARASASGGIRDYYQGAPYDQSLLSRLLAAPRIVSDAPIDHGSSGGVLANTNGEVVGVTTNVDSRNKERSYSVPGEMAQRLLKDNSSAFAFNYENRSNIEEHPWLYGAKDAGMVALAAKFPKFSMPAMGILYGKDMLAAGDHLLRKDGYGKTSSYALEAAADSAAFTGAFLSLSSRFRPVGYALVGARIGMEVVQDFWRDKPHLKAVTNQAEPHAVGRSAEPFLWGAYDPAKEQQH